MKQFQAPIQPSSFLDEPQSTTLTGLIPALLEQQANVIVDLLREIRDEVRKITPDVMAFPKLSNGTNVITAGTAPRGSKMRFMVNGMPSMIYKIVVYSTFTGVSSLSLNGGSQLKDGVPLTGVPIELDIAVDNVDLFTDGTFDCPINSSSDPAHGGIYVFAWTIPTFEIPHDAPLHSYTPPKE